MAVVERFKQELMYGPSAGTRKMWVAVVERWPLVEVRLYCFLTFSLPSSSSLRKVPNNVALKVLRVTLPYSLQAPCCLFGANMVKKFVKRLYICQQRGRKFKLQRERTHHVDTNESDWLIYARAFLLLCYVTKEGFSCKAKIT